MRVRLASAPGSSAAGLCALRSGDVCGRWLELPEAFGLGVAVAEVVEAEEGEVGENDEKAEDCDEQEQGRREAGLRAAEAAFSDG